jgi:hypothetical protein
MKVEFGSEAAPESEAAHSSNEGNTEKADEPESEESWEEIKHESVEGKEQADDKKQRVEKNEVPPDFLPRTPRPYDS